MRSSRSVTSTSQGVADGLRPASRRSAKSFQDVQLRSHSRNNGDKKNAGLTSNKSPNTGKTSVGIAVNTSKPTLDQSLDDIHYKNKLDPSNAKPLWYPESDAGSETLLVPEIRLPPTPVPSLNPPPFGLQRETTSFGVYSNLSSHNRPVKEAEQDDHCYVATEATQTKLLQATKNGELSKVRRFLSENPNMRLNFTDEEDGSTILHHAIRSGNKEILQLIRQRGPPLHTADKNGQTALHLAAALGQGEVVYTLLKHGCDINKQNEVSGRTALHEAMSAGQSEVVELLLYTGADTTIRDKEDLAATDLCNDTFTKLDLKNILHLIAKRRMDVQDIHIPSKARLKTLEVSIDSLKEADRNEDTLVICKRHLFEELNTNFNLANGENIASDLFCLRFGSYSGNLRATVTIPIFNVSMAAKEEIEVKTNDGQTIKPVDVSMGDKYWMCMFTADLNTFDVFVATCRPKVDQMEIGKNADIFQSTTDNRVKVHIAKLTFNKPAVLSMEVVELLDDVEIAEDQILSSTPFYKLHSDKTFTKPIQMELPRPADYGQHGVLLALTYSPVDNDWLVDESIRQPDPKQDTVAFSVKRLPVHAVIVKAKHNYDKPMLIKEITDIHKQALTPERKVCFICLTKRLEHSSKFSVLLECCEARKLESRRRLWLSNGYFEQQKLELIDTFSVLEKQQFMLKYIENSVFKKPGLSFSLEFHPKRDNFIQFEVTIQSDCQFLNGCIYVYNSNDYKESKNDFELFNGNDNRPLTIIDVSLTLNRTDSRSSSEASLDVPKSTLLSVSNQHSPRNARTANGDRVSPYMMAPLDTRDPTLLGFNERKSSETDFLHDQLIDSLTEDMEEEWYKIFVLMGIPFGDIEEVVIKSGDIRKRTKRVFQRWRNKHEEDENCGVPLLLSALFKGGRRDIANTAQIALKKWYENETDKESQFYKWVTKAYKNGNLLVPADYPTPMSDAYLVLMSDELPPSRELARALGLEESELDDVLETDNNVSTGIKVMKLLTLFRETVSSRLDALSRLIDCLDDLEFTKIRSYAIMCAKAWIKRTATRKDDPFRSQVDNLMKNLQ